jgi:hypothetical protein
MDTQLLNRPQLKTRFFGRAAKLGTPKSGGLRLKAD